MTALAGVLLWLSGAATMAAIQLARDFWRHRELPPATRRQIHAARTASRLRLPALYERHPHPDEESR